MIESTKEEERVLTILFHVLRDSPIPSRNILTAIQIRKSHTMIQTWPVQTKWLLLDYRTTNAVHHLSPIPFLPKDGKAYI